MPTHRVTAPLQYPNLFAQDTSEQPVDRHLIGEFDSVADSDNTPPPPPPSPQRQY